MNSNSRVESLSVLSTYYLPFVTLGRLSVSTDLLAIDAGEDVTPSTLVEVMLFNLILLQGGTTSVAGEENHDFWKSENYEMIRDLNLYD